jgi:hypothetical protein
MWQIGSRLEFETSKLATNARDLLVEVVEVEVTTEVGKNIGVFLKKISFLIQRFEDNKINS